jgi:hypothetical protein
MRVVVCEPIRKDFMLARIVCAQHRKQAGIEGRQGIEIFTVDILDPLAILFRVSTISNAGEQRRHFLAPPKKTQPDRTNLHARPAGLVDQREANYGFGAAAAEAAAEVASAAALAAVAESAAAEAAASAAGAAAGGGVVSVVGAGASVLLPQALSTSAAIKALKASLVFIYRYPRNI